MEQWRHSDFPSDGSDNQSLYRAYTLKEIKELVLGQEYQEPQFIVPDEVPVEDVSVKVEAEEVETLCEVFEENLDYKFESEYALLDEFMEDEDIAELIELYEVRTIEETREFFVVTDCEAVFFTLQMIFAETVIVPKLDYATCNAG